MLASADKSPVPPAPRIASGGDEYVRALRPSLLDEAADLRGAAAALRELAALPAAEIAELRRRAAEQSAPHAGDAYQKTFAAFTQRMIDRPRLSAADRPPVWRPGHWLPFALLNRLPPQRWPRRGRVYAPPPQGRNAER